VLNYAAPTDGTSILFANLDQGLIWSKKFIQGQTYIQPYRIIPINNETKPPEDKPKATTEDKLDQLLTLLLRRENESTVYDEHASKPVKEQKS
jgi:hypothetical protein